MPAQIWVYVLAMGAAFLFALGSVIQQRVAAEAPPEKALSFSLLLWLVRRRLWLMGIVGSFVGNLLSADALGKGGVALVQPLLNVRLLFALGIAAVWSKAAISRRDWGGAVAAGLGLGLFVAVGRPARGDALAVSPFHWALALAGVAVVVAVLYVAAKRFDPAREATLLASAAGVLFALQSSMTEVTVTILRRDGVLAVVTHWQSYAVVASALSGAVLIQSAYNLAPLTASYPALATTEPLAGIAIGVTVLGGSLRATPVALVAEIVGLAVMTAGVYRLATSPLITGQLAALRRRREEGQAFRTLDELERDLAALSGDMASFMKDERHSRRRIEEHLRSAERERDRLRELKDDLVRYRELEREELEHMSPKEQAMLAPLEAELDERASELDASAERLDRRFEELRARCRALSPG